MIYRSIEADIARLPEHHGFPSTYGEARCDEILFKEMDRSRELSVKRSLAQTEFQSDGETAAAAPAGCIAMYASRPANRRIHAKAPA